VRGDRSKEAVERNREVQSVAAAFGYTLEELTAVPAEANIGLTFGNAVATANLKPGEVVVDLGSGGHRRAACILEGRGLWRN
jgi:hypothetical protein